MSSLCYVSTFHVCFLSTLGMTSLFSTRCGCSALDVCCQFGRWHNFHFVDTYFPEQLTGMYVLVQWLAHSPGSDLQHTVTGGNPDAKRLYDDLLSNYNKLVRPVVNVSDALTVRIKLKLSQLIDVNLKNQIMTTNLWVEQSWYDYKLKVNKSAVHFFSQKFLVSTRKFREYFETKIKPICHLICSLLNHNEHTHTRNIKWEPREYGGVEMLHVPSDHIWRPDIVVRHVSNILFIACFVVVFSY